MILSRKEFSLRWGFRNFKTIEETEALFSVESLMDEIKADAAYRNHEYLFDKSDLSKVICDDEVGVNKYCNANVITEQERLDFVEKQVRENNYHPVSIYQHINHPTIIYVDDGFHRIYSAKKLKKAKINCRIKKGYFLLEKAINFEDLSKLIKMVGEMFPNHCDVEKLIKFLKKVPKNKQIHTSIGYGKDAKV